MILSSYFDKTKIKTIIKRKLISGGINIGWKNETLF